MASATPVEIMMILFPNTVNPLDSLLFIALVEGLNAGALIPYAYLILELT